MKNGPVYLVFDGPPGPVGPRFIEAEDVDGKSIRAGLWGERPDGLWELQVELASTDDPGDKREFPVPMWEIRDAGGNIWTQSKFFSREDAQRYLEMAWRGLGGTPPGLHVERQKYVSYSPQEWAIFRAGGTRWSAKTFSTHHDAFKYLRNIWGHKVPKDFYAREV